MCALFIFVLLPARSETATAADSVIRCRCGVPFSAAPFQPAFWTASSFAPFATTAADSVIRCRCGVPFSAAPFQPAFWMASSFAPFAATAADSAIRCRCGMSAPPFFFQQSFLRWKTLLRDGGPDTYGCRNGGRGRFGRIGVLTQGPGLFE